VDVDWNLMQEIFLIEDSESDARLFQRTLALAGVHNKVHTFITGNEAVASFASMESQLRNSGERLRAIFMIDLKLPDISGFEILSWLQDREVFALSLRVVLSQLDDIPSIRRAYELGANSFLIKPAKQEDLDELIKVFPGFWERAWDVSTLPLRRELTA
jgi:CheY-like chemotaxis protein